MSQDQEKRAAYRNLREIQLNALISHVIRHELVDGILIVRLNRLTSTVTGENGEPQTVEKTFFEFHQDGIETAEMIGIINKLMTDVNKAFAEQELDPPFPDAKPFVKSFPPQEGH